VSSEGTTATHSSASEIQPPIPLRRSWARVGWSLVKSYFGGADPTFWTVLAPMMLLSIAIFSRWPTTNFIFDEQEALLANPYVNGVDGLTFWDAIHRDFWGLLPDRSIGSYRPVPNFFWRALWQISKQPFVHHFYNLVFHALVATVLTLTAFQWSRRRDVAWLSGLAFLTSAVLTEAVSGIVGIADVLGGLGAVLALFALGLPAYAMPLGVFAAVTLGLFSKESALVCVPLVPFAAWVTAPLVHPERPLRALRAALALVAAAGAFVLYVELRRRWFTPPLSAELALGPGPDATFLTQKYHELLVWFHQAPLPRDRINNPLAEADFAHRLGGALRVYWRGFLQVLFPQRLSGDYSYPAEPIPETPWFFESVAGAFMMVMPVVGSLLAAMSAMLHERRFGRVVAPRDPRTMRIVALAFFSVGAMWMVVSYFPHSNIPVVLPTVRAERFWYFPVIGTSLVIGVAMASFVDWARRRRGHLAPATGLVATFFAFQGIQAYRHAMDYESDLTFWEATKDAVPRSAKAHINYSVMVGAHERDLETRLRHSDIARQLAPKWPMAQVYTGDTLCRMDRASEAWPYYREGFDLGPDEPSLIALGLQCLYDKGELYPHGEALRELAAKHPGSWIAYLAIDTLNNGETNKGVDPKYRPRGYNEGPKESGSTSATAEPTTDPTAGPTSDPTE
jgi:hypothetical protein